MFYDKLIETCKMREKKLTPLLKNLSMSTGSIEKWRNGTLPNSETLSNLAEALDVSTDYLLCKTDDPTPPNKKASSEDDSELDEETLRFVDIIKDLTPKNKEMVTKMIELLISQQNE